MFFWSWNNDIILKKEWGSGKALARSPKLRSRSRSLSKIAIKIAIAASRSPIFLAICFHTNMLQPLKLFCTCTLYRVSQRTLPVEFFLNFYGILQHINLKFGIDDVQVLSYAINKAWSICSASVSVMSILMFTSTSLWKLIYVQLVKF